MQALQREATERHAADPESVIAEMEETRRARMELALDARGRIFTFHREVLGPPYPISQSGMVESQIGSVVTMHSHPFLPVSRHLEIALTNADDRAQLSSGRSLPTVTFAPYYDVRSLL
jgi:hypothetical protein